MSSKIILVLVLVAVQSLGTTVASCPQRPSRPQRSYFEERLSYLFNPQCRPSKLDQGIKCSAVGPAITVQGGLYANWELHYVPLASAYYVARFADALGYQNRCPTNTSFLKELDIQTPWSGTHGAIALDGGCGYQRVVRRECVFPTADYPFLCTGTDGTTGTFGKRLDTYSYISILQGANLRWTLFASCWGAKTPENPNAVEIATSFNVFNLDPVFSAEDRALVIAELKKRGFNTDPSNIIEFDYSTTQCN